jgi:hypothetical protein
VQEIFAKAQRTLNSKSLGGIAGGSKFICQGILYKLSKGATLIKSTIVSC